MKQAFSKSRWLWLLFAVFALAACVLQAYAILTVYEVEEIYFKSASLYPFAALGCAVIAAVFGSVAAIRTAPAHPAATPFPRLAIPAPTLIGFLLSAIAIALSQNTMTNPIIRPITVGFLLIAALYSVLVQISFFRRRLRALTVLLGFGAVLATILINAYYYFDVSVEMNAPLKTTVQTAILFFLLYQVAELRYLLGDPQGRVYLMLSAWTVAFGSLVSIPLPLAYLTSRIDRIDYAVGGVLMLFVTATVVLRVLRLFHPSHEKESEQSRQELQVLVPLWADAASLDNEAAATEESTADTEGSPVSKPETDPEKDTQAVPNETDRKDQP